jgi:hypothetical protein
LFAKVIKQVLLALGIMGLHILHLGRNLGPKLSEMLEEKSYTIHQLGNWNPSMQDSCYMTKLPMGPIWKLAGFVHTNVGDGMYQISDGTFPTRNQYMTNKFDFGLVQFLQEN